MTGGRPSRCVSPMVKETHPPLSFGPGHCRAVSVCKQVTRWSCFSSTDFPCETGDTACWGPAVLRDPTPCDFPEASSSPGSQESGPR